ncbi:Uncharacterised protein [Mycolicibacterium phlei]|uniref:S1 family peptidase n=1 Tax=Mycobacteroides chelonae TaxID=1774 RepID=UPI000618D98B|nr:serine protease [Mycobacteroides chelonae]AKC38716.1 hypothetical protein GR01_09280 [Mycobacteroides chelonae]ANB00902.1 hypothetical protein BB28_09795 [Mycobacteroides chelonae CCUG 47445]OLT78063.1 hypothetical protein BKG56_13845 [Mycobacteroides chelonae]VEG16097.1 Uncharacterised protein [Mycolicibacterium phlei]
MSRPTIIVNNLVSRVHLYTAAAITAHVYDRGTGKNLDSRNGTVFIMKGRTGLYFVTNRHVLEDDQAPSGIDSIEISGHFQSEEDPGAAPVPWTYTHKRPEVVFHSDAHTDLALIPHPEYSPRFGSPAEPPVCWSASNTWAPMTHEMGWLASEAELQQLQPGDQVFIAGYPGVAYVGGNGRSANKDDKPIIVSGIVASDSRYPATFGDATLHNAVLCQSFSWGGMSGAPVFGFSKSIGITKIVGVNAGHIKGQGPAGGVISHFVRSSALVDLLVELGEPSPQPLTMTTRHQTPPTQIDLSRLEWHLETEEELNQGNC